MDASNRSRTAIASDRAKRTAAGLRLGELDKRDARAEAVQSHKDSIKANRRTTREEAALHLGVTGIDQMSDDDLADAVAKKATEKELAARANIEADNQRADRRVAASEKRQGDKVDEVERRTIERERRKAIQQAKLGFEFGAKKLKAVNPDGTLTVQDEADPKKMNDLLDDARAHAVGLGLDDHDVAAAVDYFKQLLTARYLQLIREQDRAHPPQRGENPGVADRAPSAAGRGVEPPRARPPY